jgi:hypothetical protein
MNFGKAFTYVFDDPDWFNKVLIPILIGLIPVVGQLVVTGWMLDLMRNVSNRVERPLPELDFSRQLGRGFRWMLVGLVYAFPMFVLYLLIFAPMIASGNSDGPSVFGVILMLLAGILMFLFGLVLLVLLPAAQVTFAVKDTFASAFDFKSILGLVRNNLTAWLLVIGGTIVAGFIAPLGAIALGIGAIVTAFYAQTMTAHLSGQAYAMSQTKDGAGIPSY